MAEVEQVAFILQVIDERINQMQGIVDDGGDVLFTIPAKWNLAAMTAFKTIIEQHLHDPFQDIKDDPILRPIMVALGFE